MIQDRNVDWLDGHKFLQAGPGQYGCMGLVNTTIIEGFDTGVPQFLEHSTFGFGHVDMVVADLISWRIPLRELEINPAKPIEFVVEFNNSVNTGTVSWIILADVKAIGVALAAAATALDTVVPLLTANPAAANGTAWTGRGKKNANFATKAQIDAGAQLVISCELDAESGAGVVGLHGVHLFYKKRTTRKT